MTHTNHLRNQEPELILLTGHSAPIECIAFSPDCHTLATGSYDGSVILWDVPSGSMRARLRGHDSNLHLAFSPDGATLATADNNALRLWDVATGKWLGTLWGYCGPIAFDGNSSLLAMVWCEGMVRLDTESGEVLHRLPAAASEEESLSASAISPDCTTFAATIYKSSQSRLTPGSVSLFVWDFVTGGVLRKRKLPRMLRWKVRCCKTGKLYPTHGAQADVDKLAISPNNRTVALGGGMILWICDTRTGRRTHLLVCGMDGAMSLDFSPDGKLLAAGTKTGAVRLWSMPSGREHLSIPAHSSWASAVTFSADGRLLASASHDKSVRISNVETGECHRKLVGLEHEVRCISYSPDGLTLASGYQDGTIRLWSSTTGALRTTLRSRRPEVSALCFSRDGAILVSASHTRWDWKATGEVEQWHVATGEQVGSWETDPGTLSSVAFADDEALLIASLSYAGSESTLTWDLSTGTPRYQVEGRVAAVSPNGKLLATSAGWGGKICLWDAVTGKPIREMAAPEVTDWIAALRFSPDGETLLAGFGGFGIGLWSVKTGERLFERQTHADSITSLSFSPDGTSLAVAGCYQETLVLWRLLPQPQEYQTLSGHESNVRGVCYSPTGNRLASAGADGTVRLWDPASGQLLATLLILPNLAGEISEEWITYTPDGHYHSSPGADQFVNWRIHDQMLPSQAYSSQYHRPDMVAATLA